MSGRDGRRSAIQGAIGDFEMTAFFFHFKGVRERDRTPIALAGGRPSLFGYSLRGTLR